MSEKLFIPCEKPLKEWKRYISREISHVSENPVKEAEILLSAYLSKDQLWVITNNETTIYLDDKFNLLLEKRKRNIPLEYITQNVSFYSRSFHICEGVLIPRPETELLIDEAAKLLARGNEKKRVAEVGIGSGVISIILALQFPNISITATDINKDALKLAEKNIKLHGVEEQITLKQSSLLESAEGEFDMLVSNPPYIQNGFKLEPHLYHEPHNALFGGEEGDELIQALIDTCYTRNIAQFVCEMGFDQKKKVQVAMSERSCASLKFYRDLSGFDRGFILEREK